MFKRLAAILIGMAFVIGTMTGCGHSITNGTVIDKKFVPAHSWETTEPTYVSLPVQRTRTSCSGTGTKRTCSTSSYTDYRIVIVGYHQEQHHADDQYTLTLRDSNSKDTGTVEVSAERYKNVSLGDTFNADQ